MATRALASYRKGDNLYHIDLTLLFWKDNGTHYVYAPALDLTGYGKTEVEAKKSFETTLGMFADYSITKGTIYKELERLGWTTNKKKKRVKAPTDEELMEDNEALRELASRPGVLRQESSVALAL